MLLCAECLAIARVKEMTAGRKGQGTGQGLVDTTLCYSGDSCIISAIACTVWVSQWHDYVIYLLFMRYPADSLEELMTASAPVPGGRREGQGPTVGRTALHEQIRKEPEQAVAAGPKVGAHHQQYINLSTAFHHTTAICVRWSRAASSRSNSGAAVPRSPPAPATAATSFRCHTHNHLAPPSEPRNHLANRPPALI